MRKKTTKQAKTSPTPGVPPQDQAPSPEERPAEHTRVVFPVVGIGASAGGLEALESFLRNTPDDAGLAIVIIQHLDPTQKGTLPPLLQRATTMPVLEVADKTTIESDHVYITPPNSDLSILGNTLYLFAPTQAKGLRLPIDFFLRSLADDRGAGAIGVILSGMGSDGVLGLRGIKEHGGGTFVQEPASAKFDGMPRSSIDAGLADVVAPVNELPGKILSYIKHASSPAVLPQVVLSNKDQNAMEKVLILLRTQTGHDFTQYKKTTLQRRIERRMGLHQIEKIASYVQYLRENRQEVDLLFKELLIGVTSFFRDPETWAYLKDTVLPALLKTRPEGGTLRVWTPGCSTGEEAYTMAMIISEVLAALDPPRSHALQIFATDLDPEAIRVARGGFYPENIASDVSQERLRRFFVKEDNGWRIGANIRESVVFAIQNVLRDPPFTKLDILVCRNLLIYLNQELQKKLLPLFHYSLNPGGTLFLGSAEAIGTFTDLFSPLNSKLRLFQRLEAVIQKGPVDFPSPFVPVPSVGAESPLETSSTVNVQTLTEQILLYQYSPAAVLTTKTGDIVYIHGRTGKYLEPAAGKANLNVFAMARDGLRLRLHSSFEKALAKNKPVTLKSIKIGENDGTHLVNVTIRPMVEPLALGGMVLIVFSDLPEPAKTSFSPLLPDAASAAQVESLKLELQQAMENAQIAREEMQTSQEELKSSNEELQSTNEELQSANEELTTSREEMQSMNEELHTVNQELLAKVDDLSRTNNDMNNLLNSTDIATLFLDDEFNVRSFTPKVTSIFKLIPGDVGRPLTDVATKLDYPDMADDAREVLRTLVFAEKAVPTADGRWFLTRIMPYRTQDNRIDGLVITFSDISVAKSLEARLREREQESLELFRNMPLPFALLDSVFEGEHEFVDGRIAFVNAAYERLMGETREIATGKGLQEHFPGIESTGLAACKSASANGIPGAFDLRVERIGKTVRCSVYRPGEMPDRFCLIFEIPVGISKR